MLSTLFGLKSAQSVADRVSSVLSRVSGHGARVGFEFPEMGRRRLEVGVSERLYFSVRSVAVTGCDHILQYAFADDRGNVALSTLTRAPSPLAMVMGSPPEDLAAPPLEPEDFRRLMEQVCGGASLVAFHRVLQGGLLPKSAAEQAASMDCAWRRFQRVARARGIELDPHASLTLGDCLTHAGLSAPDSEDAAVRALAIRSLWRWMDAVE
jgi:hypothetical protein